MLASVLVLENTTYVQKPNWKESFVLFAWSPVWSCRYSSSFLMFMLILILYVCSFNDVYFYLSSSACFILFPQYYNFLRFILLYLISSLCCSLLMLVHSSTKSSTILSCGHVCHVDCWRSSFHKVCGSIVQCFWSFWSFFLAVIFIFVEVCFSIFYFVYEEEE